MKCFNHHDRDAFCIDQITGKGLCLECVEEHEGFFIEKNSIISKDRVEHQICMRKYDKKIGIIAVLLAVVMFFYFLYLFICNCFFTEERLPQYCFLYLLAMATLVVYFLQILKFYFKKER